MVHRRVLSNGTRLLVREMRTAPVVALGTWIPVGAADDPEHLSGISHFLEHMLFKDEAGARLTRAVQSAGGYLNAHTGYDHTAYYEVIPSGSWLSVLEAQIEVLSGPSFHVADIDSERAVILDELGLAEGDPSSLAWRRLMECAFAGSSYGRPVTGTREALVRIGAADLARYHRLNYAPERRVCVVVGDVDADTALDRAEEALSRGRGPWGADAGRCAASPEAGGTAEQVPHWNHAESVLEVEVGVPYVVLAFEAPDVLHEDVPVLDVLCGLLGLGRSSRLRRSLQYATGIVSRVTAGVASYRDTGVVGIRAVGTPGTHPERIVDEICRELRRLRTQAISDTEMAKSVGRLEAGYALEHETVESVAATLGFFEMVGDHCRAEEYVNLLAGVTTCDLLRVADEYLSPERMTVSAVVPQGLGKVRLRGAAPARAAATPEGEDAAANEAAAGWGVPTPFSRPLMMLETGHTSTERTMLESGATLIVNESHAIPIVSVAVGFAGGFVDETDSEVGLTKATLHHMLKGTARRPGSRLSDDMEGLGSGFSTALERDGFGVGASVLSDRLGEALEVLFDAVAAPSFERSTFDTVRSELTADIAEDEDTAATRTALRLLPLLFPDHPYGRPISGTIDTISGLEWTRTADWHREHFSADGLVVCMSGDVTIEEAAAHLNGLVGGLGRSRGGRGGRVVRQGPAGRLDEKLPGGGPSTIALGFPGPRMGTREAVALQVLASSLTMMGGRLWQSLREGPPFAYAVRATPLSLRLGGAFVGHVTAPPGSEEVAVERFVSELSGVGEDGLADQELRRGRRCLAGMLEIRMQRSAARASGYAMAEITGLGFERVDLLPGIVRGITGDDVAGVARKYLTAEDGPAVAILRGRQAQ
jgi:zinc protease